MSPRSRIRAAIVPLLAALLCSLHALGDPIVVVDDEGLQVRLPQAARRIVSLAPHVTETLFDVGAGSFIVGTVDASDYPEAAKRIPRIGDYSALDLERIAALKPDLIVSWLHGNSERQLAQIQALGIPVYHSEPRTLAAISKSLLDMGRLAGTGRVARRAAAAYEARLAGLRAKYAHRSVVSVFYQAWRNPLMTVNGRQIISDAIRLCGGRNVFANASELVPSVDPEAVVAVDPDAIVTAAPEEDRGVLEDWRRFPSLRAVRDANLLVVNTETLARQSPRILDGAEMLCERLDRARARRR